MKRLIFGSMLCFIGTYLFISFSSNADELEIEYKKQKAISSEQTAYSNIATLLDSADDLHDLLEPQRILLLDIPKDKREDIQRVIDLKYIIFSFQKAERMLVRARKLQETIDPIKPPPPPPEPTWENPNPPPPPPVKLHPLVESMVEEIIALYKECKEKADHLVEKKDNPSFNFLLNYTKGEIYYRHTQLLSTSDNVSDLFNQTVTFYKMALRNKLRDTDTVINIEILIRNKDRLLANGRQPLGQRRRLLKPSVGIGSSTGI